VLRREFFVTDFANDLQGQTLPIWGHLVGVLVVLEAEMLLQLCHAGELGRTVFALKRLLLLKVKGSFNYDVIFSYSCMYPLFTLCHMSMQKGFSENYTKKSISERLTWLNVLFTEWTEDSCCDFCLRVKNILSQPSN